MTTSLYDRPLHGNKYKTSSGIGDYNGEDDNYDAIKDAKEKVRRNPEKYSPRRTHGSSGGMSSRREVRRITVVIVHRCPLWTRPRNDISITNFRRSQEASGGCISQGVCDEISLSIEDTFPDVRITEKYGPLDSFEVYINGRRIYSRLSQGGYPYEDEVVEAVYRAKNGKTFYQLQRGSSVCSIL